MKEEKELKYREDGLIPVDLTGARPWLGESQQYEPGTHRMKIIGWTTGEAGTGAKQLIFVKDIISGPEGDVGRKFQQYINYETDGGKGILRGFVEAINPLAVTKRKKDDKTYEVVDFTALLGWSYDVDFVEETFLDKKSGKDKTRSKEDLTTIENVAAPGKKGKGKKKEAEEEEKEKGAPQSEEDELASL